MYEIERKFLLERLPDSIDDNESTDIAQGYLAVDDSAEVRVRSRAGEHVLTVKGGHGQVRREVSIELTDEQFDQLWPLTEGRRISKRRWVIPQGELQLEIDAYRDKLDGLLVAEVEFESEEASKAFEPPEWFGQEVTEDRKYSNAALALEGRPA